MKGIIERWHNQDGEHFYCWEIRHSGEPRIYSAGDWETYQEAYEDLNSALASISRWGIEMPSEVEND